MKIAIRVDASSQIGTGHVMRCLTLATALVEPDTQIHFICRHLPVNLGDLIRDKGFKVFLLPPSKLDQEAEPLAHASWLGVTQEVDAKATLDIVEDQGYDWLITDHYALDIRWEKILRPYVKKLMVIDDLADRLHDCDVLLDQNYYLNQETRYKDKLPNKCLTLLGPRYTLLRKEFSELRTQLKPKDNTVKRILVFFGGVDALDFTTKAIKAISAITEYEFSVDVVIGDQHPNKEAIIALCERSGFSCYVQTDKMAELMAQADLSIGAGGGAVWERACLKLPTIAIPIATHQIKQLTDIAAKGITYTFDANDYTPENIKKHIHSILDNPSLRHLMSVNSAEIVDGKGVERVKKVLLSNQEITLRLAVMADEKSLFEWRNHSKIREVSFNKNEISWDQHHQWFNSILQNDKRLLLIGEYKNKPIGVVRFDFLNETAEISIYLVQQHYSAGLGMPLIKAAEDWIYQYRKTTKRLNANVIESNGQSQRFFIKAGYTPVIRTYSKEL